MRFFERFRDAISRYEEGVHELGPPATEQAIASAERELGRSLPDAYREFLLQWNGGYLFHDDYSLFGVEGAPGTTGRVSAAQGLIAFGMAADALYFDARGRVVAVDPETEGRRVQGSSFDRWLDAVVAREGLLYEHDGEFRDEAFAGDELSPKVRRKRAQAGVKADPTSPAWREELAAILVEAGRSDQAVTELEQAVLHDPEAASAWFTLGKLRRDGGDPGSASEAFLRAAGDGSPAEEAAFFLAHAARAAAEAGRPGAREIAARASSLAPAFAAEQRAAAEHLMKEGEVEEALERIALALAVSPDEPGLQALLAVARARRSMRVV